MTTIINNAIVNSYFDSDLKLADLTPVHKDDDITNKKNYRNISLLPIVSKIFEKIMRSQISGYMEIILKSFLMWISKRL